jgi:thioredoxin reductase (NADPH)
MTARRPDGGAVDRADAAAERVDAAAEWSTETPDTRGAYPRLTEAQLAGLTELGERRATRAGELLTREGERSEEFLVVLDGLVAGVRGHGTDQRRVFSVDGPGRFLGELGLLVGQPAFLTSEVKDPGSVLAVPVSRLAELVSRDPSLGDLILRAYVMRREILIGSGAGVRIIGSRFSPETRRLREFLSRNRVPYRWIDLEEDRNADRLLRQLGVSPAETPVLICGNTQVLRDPTNAELARALGFPPPAASDESCDVLVVGAGPAGLAAAVYGASEGLQTVVIDAVATGGQAGTSSRIENYLGFPSGISGAELADRAVIQALKFGARVSVSAEACSVRQTGGLHTVQLPDGGRIQAHAMVIATGARYRRLEVPGIEDYEGSSVYYAATLVEAQDCNRTQVAVVGGGNSAGQATVFLSRYASRVTLLVRDNDLGKDMSRYLVDRIERLTNVDVRLGTEVRALEGEQGALTAVEVEQTGTGERERVPVQQLFVFIGAQPCTAWLRDYLRLDDRGFVVTGPDAVAHQEDAVGVLEAAGEGSAGAVHRPRLLETSRPGVFAVGDVRSGSVKRVASAVGDGAMAIRLVHEHLSRREG